MTGRDGVEPPVQSAGSLFCIYQVEGQSVPEVEAQVECTVERTATGLCVRVERYTNPDLERRLQTVGEPIPDDWRVLVQSIAIDPAYDGQIFRAALVDAPPGKTEVVRGVYELDPAPDATIALLFTDVTGREWLSTQALCNPNSFSPLSS